MKTKFIGLEGFNEIESLSTDKKNATRKSAQPSVAYKTVRFVKRASVYLAKSAYKKISEVSARFIGKTSDRIAAKAVKAKKSPSVLDRCYNENRNGLKGEFTSSLKDAVSGISVVSGSNKHAHSAPATSYRAHTILKKKAVLAVVACASAIMLSCVTVASALDAPENVTKVITSSASVKIVPTDNNDNNSENTAVNSGAVFSATADEATSTLGSGAYASITKALMNDNIGNGCSGLYIDGKLIGATSETDALNAALDKVLTDYKEGYDDETTTEFANDVVVKGGSFSQDEIMTVSEIMSAAEGKFSISLSTDIVYTREIDYEIKTEYDDSQSSSYKKVKTEGKSGKEEVTIRTTFTDGMQTDAVETDSKVITKAVDEVVVRGSKDGIVEDSSSSSKSSSSGSTSGTFCWPLPYTHNITSEYEWRWGRMHWGIDIAAGGVYGQPIVASDGGTVVQAGDNGDGYGNYVIIDHGNGYKTLYGHCSSVAVSYGQHVSQGDTIGYVGSTGNSTGPHLHFEIIYNSNKLNPLQFVS
ncbi:peptidoglycan DD-metalloendopeptidase family protein [Ruminococcus sp.]|uniref:peptidoglycan DD-metalloendopeptidase family protein n=1 Tax=Ruminococcus sp. TaxID=41978 RepID=UPI003F1123E4